MRNFDKTFLGIDPLPENTNLVHVDMHFGCINIMYRGENCTQLSLIMRTDPHVKLVPTWLLNFSTKKILYQFMS